MDKASHDELHVLDLLIPVLKHIKGCLLILALFLGGAIFYAYTATPIYSSYAVLMPLENDSQSSTLATMITAISGGMAGAANTSNLQKMVVVTKSRSLAEKVYARLKDELLPV